MKTYYTSGGGDGLVPSRSDEGSVIELTDDFGSWISHRQECAACGQTTGWAKAVFEGFRKGTAVRVVRVESSSDAVHAMGHFEGYAHVTSVELQDVETGEVACFSREGLTIPGKRMTNDAT